ncbi:hypothetical protein R1flu_016818 [Riccia fluitans]|uniref:Uncharacterized protein n=1 Tax=Riccia fluitans TaxID=41844 RepID=A0ABD1YMX7_9MARC
MSSKEPSSHSIYAAGPPRPGPLFCCWPYFPRSIARAPIAAATSAEGRRIRIAEGSIEPLLSFSSFLFHAE